MMELRVFGNVHFKSHKTGLVNVIFIFLASSHSVCQLPSKEGKEACPHKRLTASKGKNTLDAWYIMGISFKCLKF